MTKLISMRDHGNRCPEGAIRIDRATKWGNPFRLQRGVERGATLERYRKHLWREIKAGRITLPELKDLDGKTLACWCAPHACHGEVLALAAAWAMQQWLDHCDTEEPDYA